MVNRAKTAFDQGKNVFRTRTRRGWQGGGVAHNGMDRRKHQRFNVEKAIYIEVAGSVVQSEADNTIIRCVTLDVSAGGLRVAVPIPIAKGSILNIAVPMDNWKENLELVGEAMWLKENPDKEGYWVGLELKDASREDLVRWFKVVQTLKKQAR